MAKWSELDDWTEASVQPIVEMLCCHLAAETGMEEVPETLKRSITIAAKDLWRKGYTYAHEENTVRLPRKTDPAFPPKR
jgi:replication-associated recombination protein RarA